jgi:SAM-dependent methyltransferase
MKNSSSEFYTNIASVYADYAKSRKPYLDAVDAFVVREAQQGGNYIDIGCGDGRRTLLISKAIHAYQTVGIDESRGMLELANSNANYSFEQIDVGQEQIPGGPYTTVTMLWNVFGHIVPEKRLSALKNVANALHPEGAFFIDVNNRYNIAQYGFGNVVRNIWKDIFKPNKLNGDYPLHLKVGDNVADTMVRISTDDEMRNYFRESGLHISKTTYINYLSGNEAWTMFGGQLVYKLEKVR